MTFTLVMAILLKGGILLITEVPGFKNAEDCAAAAQTATARVRDGEIEDARIACVKRHNA